MKLDLTASGYIIHENRLLLILHKKLGLWLPPGGHIDPNETPDAAAIREIKEEVGLDVEIVPLHDVPFGGHMKQHCAVPIYANVHNVGDHDHYCLFYLCRPKNTTVVLEERAVKDFRWVTKEELETDPQITEDVRNIGLRAFRMLETVQ